MLVRSESTPQDASSLHSDTRSKSGILTPASDGSAESHSNARKRKREDIPVDNGLEDLLSESFSVKVCCIPPYHRCPSDTLHSHILHLHMINHEP